MTPSPSAETVTLQSGGPTMMSKSVRCTVCTWRGSEEEARLARPVRPSMIPQPMQEHQGAYESVQQTRAQLGREPLPSCPSCGHHLTYVVKRHRRGSIHP